MYDIEKLTIMIKDIEKYFAELENFGLNEKNVGDTKTVYASSMAIFGIICRAIDLSEEVLVKNSLGVPRNYEEGFVKLGEKGLIDKKMSEELRKLAKERNFFAHQYFEVERKKVLKLSKEIYVVKEFVGRIKKIVEKQNKLEKRRE